MKFPGGAYKLLGVYIVQIMQDKTESVGEQKCLTVNFQFSN